MISSISVLLKLESINMYNFTLGCDPELFLFDHERSKFISAIGKIGGSKKEPLKINDIVSLQEDNVLVEFNITPAQSRVAWNEFVNSGLFEVNATASRLNLGSIICSSAILDEDQFYDEKALEFGCEPDFNIYTNTINPKPKHENPYFRSAGGHVHFGVPFKEGNKKFTLPHMIRWCDIVIGTWGKLIEPNSKRSELYGKAGCFRPKPYGFEYRTPSNFWLKSSALINEMYSKALYCINICSSVGSPQEIGISDREVKFTIDSPESTIEDILSLYQKLTGIGGYESPI